MKRGAVDSPKSGNIHVRPAFWLALTAVFALAFLIFDASWRIIDSHVVSNFSVTPEKHQESQEVLTRHVVLPEGTLDARWWIIHTQTLLEEGKWRIRFTHLDTAPDGRDVHWSNLPIWILAGISWVYGHVHGMSTVEAVPYASLYFGPTVLLMVLLLLSPWIARNFGKPATVVFLLSVVCLFNVLASFRSGETDHHGIVSIFGLVTALALAAARGGLRSKSPRDAERVSLRHQKQLFVLSGIAGACGLWVNAATQVQILAGCAFAAMLVAWLNRNQKNLGYAPELWIIWGCAGGLASLLLYLLEYFPDHLGLRLEVNNPLYSLAWAGGGLLMSRVCGWLQNRTPVLRGTGKDTSLLALALAVSVLPLVLILSAPERFFWVSGKFLYTVHKFYIAEFQNYIVYAGMQAQVSQLLDDLGTIAFTIVLVAWLLQRRATTLIQRAMLLTIFIPTCLMMVSGALQVRWISVLIPMCVACWIVSAHVLSEQFLRKSVKRQVIVLWCGALAVLLVQYPVYSASSWLEKWMIPGGFNKTNWPSIVARDAMATIRKETPHGELTILSGPNASTELTYYGNARTLGTLYWENRAGLRASADIYSTSSEKEALALLMKHRITHMVFFSWDSFGQRYVRLLRGLGRDEEVKNGFVAGLLEGTREQPLWLRPIYFPLNQKLNGEALWARIYEVVPDQTPSEWFYFVGIYQLQAKLPELAGQSFQKSLALDNGNAKAGIACASLLLLDQRPSDAVEALRFTLSHGRDAGTATGDLADSLIKSERFSDARLVLSELIAHFDAKNDSGNAGKWRTKLVVMPVEKQETPVPTPQP